jgi:hypothetical protein
VNHMVYIRMTCGMRERDVVFETTATSTISPDRRAAARRAVGETRAHPGGHRLAHRDRVSARDRAREPQRDGGAGGLSALAGDRCGFSCIVGDLSIFFVRK